MVMTDDNNASDGDKDNSNDYIGFRLSASFGYFSTPNRHVKLVYGLVYWSQLLKNKVS